MKNLHNPMFPCNIEVKQRDIDLSVLDFNNRIEAVSFNEGWGIFNKNKSYWVTDKEKEKIKSFAKDYVEFNNNQDKEDTWCSSAPIDLEVEVTNKCNQKCIHCGVECNSSGINFKLEKLIDVVDEFRSKGGQRIMLTGGEPLLYPNLEELLKFCKSVDIRNYGLVTNGTLINKSKADLLSEYFDYIIVSIHGHNPEIHDKITQLDGSFNKAKKGIGYLKDRGLDVLIFFTVMEENFESVPKMFDLVNELGCNAIRFKSLHLDGRAKDKTPISIEGKQLLSKYIERISKDKGVNLISSELYRTEYFEDIGSYKYFGCNALRTIVYLDAKGFAYPCNLMLDKSIGNVYESSLSELWNNHNANKLRAEQCLYEKEICNICGGICKAGGKN